MLYESDLELPRLPYSPTSDAVVVPRPVEVKPDSSSVDPRPPLVELVPVGTPSNADSDEEEDEDSSQSEDSRVGADLVSGASAAGEDGAASGQASALEAGQENNESATPVKRPDKLVPGAGKHWCVQPVLHIFTTKFLLHLY